MSTTALAATGDFSMSRRMVYGYDHHTYQFSNSVTKTVMGSAEYDFDYNRPYRGVDGDLSASIHKKSKNIFGQTIWPSVKSWDFTYNSKTDTFKLSNKSITLKSGTYGFTVWRTAELEIYGVYKINLNLL